MQTMAGVTRPLAASRMSTLSVPSPVWLASAENARAQQGQTRRPCDERRPRLPSIHVRLVSHH